MIDINNLNMNNIISVENSCAAKYFLWKQLYILIRILFDRKFKRTAYNLKWKFSVTITNVLTVFFFFKSI